MPAKKEKKKMPRNREIKKKGGGKLFDLIYKLTCLRKLFTDDTTVVRIY